jgi:hypothetical protein
LRETFTASAAEAVRDSFLIGNHGRSDRKGLSQRHR